MSKPRMFIGSSTEHLDLAYAAQEGLERDIEPTVWTQGVFELSKGTLATLIDVLEESDFALFIFSPSDLTTIRDVKKSTVRDNVIFELGLFIGGLGADRCFILVPRDNDDLHIPTDLLGITSATYEPDRQDGNLVAALGPACNRIRRSVSKLGAIAAIPPAGEAEETTLINEAAPPTLYSTPGDCTALIQSWMGSRPARENVKPIHFADVDRELKLEPGSAAKYIVDAARKYQYVVSHKGGGFVLFERGGGSGGVRAFSSM